MKPPNQLNIYPQVICRTPIFSIQAVMPEKFPLLKELIRDASPDLHQLFCDLDYNSLSRSRSKISFSLWKYFNRAKFRATPFGRFAAVTLITLQTAQLQEAAIYLQDALTPIIFHDWDFGLICNESISSLINKSKYFIVNHTTYKAGNNWRCVAYVDSHYQINCISRFEEMDYIIQLTNKCVSKIDLLKAVCYKFNLSTGSVLNLIMQLVDIQLLWCDAMMNITGEDFFIRTKQELTGSSKYIISTRACHSGGYFNPQINKVTELVHFLNQHLPYSASKNLQNFKHAFQKKFDRRAVPLSIALDPELGLPYAGRAVVINDTQQQLMDQVFTFCNQDSSTQLLLNPLLKFILNSITLGEKITRLENLPTSKTMTVPSLPNTFNLLYHEYKQQPVLHHFGGCSANVLLGRFTIADDGLEALGKEIAQIEQRANPDTLFFDVSYHAEKHVDNINRRKQLYSYELPLSGWSPGELKLQLKDIDVFLDGEELVLYSKVLQKRLIPRIPTAYNSNRAELNIYRFLSDVQSQSLRTDLNLRVQDYLPGLDHYSRIVYKEFILSPETWRISDEILKKLGSGGDDIAKETLKGWLDAIGINTYFKVGLTDQTLTFDPTQEDDLFAFVNYCRQQQKTAIYITEALIDSNTTVKNEYGEDLSAEISLTLYHHEKIYEACSPPMVLYADQKAALRNIYPGNDWLYFEIYMHPSRMNQVLTSNIKRFLQVNKKLIKLWFFVRYDDGGPHLRLRLQLRDVQQAYHVISQLNQTLKQELNLGIISDVQLKTYSRELERYHPSRIHLAEAIFYQDSKYVLTLLNGKPTTTYLYHYTLQIMLSLLETSFDDEAHKLSFVMNVAANFSKEFDFTGTSFKVINQAYKQFRSDYPFAKCDHGQLPKKYMSAFRTYIKTTDSAETVAFVADAFHMHINRVFTQDQRKHEAILYQYLVKDMKTYQYHSRKTGQP
ncbi:lantibiotic dehydratase [Mucilaginibacter robiniae]|uniref:Lantibiotic dehydratase n=1 Tax=Mucilaginibacter robiniae TaxID=2728022 RepID=A0A7L5DYR5_9SPHI|nr:lantibiotic dehydratase [Mucilaginibacter robiniae]QJD96262.1 lantibiotic dehydratase [Mucilaginibacter robiniae]